MTFIVYIFAQYLYKKCKLLFKDCKTRILLVMRHHYNILKWIFWRQNVLWQIARNRINKKKAGENSYLHLIVRDSCRIQTCNLLIRSQMLYSVELRSHPF